jgi:hypothetical protein
MAHMDIFKQDAFTQVEMTDALERTEYKPGYLGTLGIFEPAPIRTDKFSIEKREHVLSLIQTSERGAPLEQQKRDQRDIRDFRTRRVAKGDTIMASEIANIRAFGKESELQQVQAEVMLRMRNLRDDVDLTHENLRLGALQGIVLDADGSTIYNWFTEWGITQPTEIDFDLDNANPAEGAVRLKCNEVVRGMWRAAKGSMVGTTELIGLCGDTFYDQLTTHKEVRATYLNQQAAAELRGPVGRVFSQLSYGDITFVNYRGTDDNSKVAVPATKCKFFPRGARGLFKHVMSPGESFDLVNTPGRPFYAIQVPDRDRNMFVDVEVYSYPMYICTNPGVLFRARNK